MVIATKDRADVLARTLQQFTEAAQSPAEIIVVDAAADLQAVAAVVDALASSVPVRHVRAVCPGAASQRNEGVALARHDTIFFADDDVVPEDGCLLKLWDALQSDPKLGGVNAMITNQQYSAPGKLSRLLFRWYAGGKNESYAGRCIGPARNLLPEDSEHLPEIVPVDWLNTTCTLYRREALPDLADGPFDRFFEGASICEDLALSLRVAREWKLANVREARIFHDSQGGSHKRRVARTTAMSLRNRHYVMHEIMARTGWKPRLQLAAETVVDLAATSLSSEGIAILPDRLLGIWRGWKQIRNDLA